MNDAALGNPLGQVLTHIFICGFESAYLLYCPNNFKFVLFRLCIDDICMYFFPLHIMQITLSSICYLNIST